MPDNLFRNKYRIPSARTVWHDYNGGAYFVTICTKDMAHFFGEIVDGEMCLTEIGRCADEQLRNVSSHYPYAKIPLWVVMPNHVHLIAFILLLILITTALSVIYVTKSSMSVHQKVIELIHMMGASDFYITIQFAMRSFKLTLIGSLIGFLLAIPIMVLFDYFLRQMSSSFVLESTLNPAQWLILISIPFLTAVLSFLTAYRTVSKTLKQTL